MSSIFDRVRQELDNLGDRVQDALKTSQLHLERSSLVALRAKAYHRLGRLVYRKERAEEVSQAELDAAFAQLDDIAAKIAKLDRELEAQGEAPIANDDETAAPPVVVRATPPEPAPPPPPPPPPPGPPPPSAA